MGVDLSKLEDFTFIAAGPLAARTVALWPNSARFMPLKRLQKGIAGECAWCNEKLVPQRRNKYCGLNCRESAFAYCNPQNPGTKAWLFIHAQTCACFVCGEIFDEEWGKRIDDHHRHLHDMQAKGWYRDLQKVPYHWIGNGIGDRFQLDHRVPLHKGGRGIGFENVQVICTPCHAKKTAAECSGRLKGLFQEHRGAQK